MRIPLPPLLPSFLPPPLPPTSPPPSLHYSCMIHGPTILTNISLCYSRVVSENRRCVSVYIHGTFFRKLRSFMLVKNKKKSLLHAAEEEELDELLPPTGRTEPDGIWLNSLRRRRGMDHDDPSTLGRASSVDDRVRYEFINHQPIKSL